VAAVVKVEAAVRAIGDIGLQTGAPHVVKDDGPSSLAKPGIKNGHSAGAGVA